MSEKVKNLIKTTIRKRNMPKKLDYSTWIFSSVDNRYFNYNSKYLFEYVKKNEPSIHPKFVINDDVLRQKLQAQYGAEYFIESKSTEGIDQVLKAGVWFTSAGLPVYGLNLENNRIVINLWHGVPLKKIALMENQTSTFYKWYFKYIFTNNYTYTLTTSSNLTEIMANSFDVAKEDIKVWGQPRNDVIFEKKNRNEYFEKIFKEPFIYKKVILYAPTYREEAETWLFPFEGFKQEELELYLKERGILLLLRTHIAERGAKKIKESSHIRFLNGDRVEDVTEALSMIDLLITDYSSMYIDYLLTEKPVLFLPYDEEQYFKTRGFNFEYKDVTPGPKPTTYQQFIEELDLLLEGEGYYLEERRKSNTYFNEVNKPCSEYICKEVKQLINRRKEQ